MLKDKDELKGAMEAKDPMALTNKKLGKIIQWVVEIQNLVPEGQELSTIEKVSMSNAFISTL